MDRYHLSWLMVGKPKDDRPRSADDRRRGGGLRPGGRRAEDRGPADEPRRGGAPGRCRSWARRAMPARAQPTDAASEAARGPQRVTDRPRVPAVGGERDVPAPDPIARDYLLLALRLDQHIPGSSTATSARPTSRRRSTWSSSGHRRGWSTTLPTLPNASRRGRRSGAPGVAAAHSWSRSRPTPGCRPATELPYLEHVSRCFDCAARSRRDEAVFQAAAARLDGLVPGDGPLGRPARGLGPAVRSCRPTGSRPSSTGWSACSAAARPRSSACPTARASASRS